MSDGTKRKLTMPPWHIPYLEKHRIRELFHELARELTIQQPVDHVLFLKQILQHAANSVDYARVVLISSPKVNACEVAVQISYFSRQSVVDDCSLMEFFKNKNRSEIPPKLLSRVLDKIVRTEQMKGWILVNCIKSAAEARAILQAGILPTHVIHLIAPHNPPLNELLYCETQCGWAEYRRTVMGIREAFKHCLLEVYLGSKSIYQIVEECYELIKVKKGVDGPKQPRIVLLGPRGSGRKTQARLLEENLNLIHVDFEYLLCQAWVSQTELGEQLRSYKDDVCFQSNLLMKVIEQRVLKQDCLVQGWVLTGFPFTATDFRYLDCMDTPPNKVIFLDCELNVCKERLINRKINVYTGSTTNMSDNHDFFVKKVLAIHPKDAPNIIDAELQFYCENYGNLRSYCGETASLVNGDQRQRWVYESICAIIVRNSPSGPPRNPCKLEAESETNLVPCPCSDAHLPTLVDINTPTTTDSK